MHPVRLVHVHVHDHDHDHVHVHVHAMRANRESSP